MKKLLTAITLITATLSTQSLADEGVAEKNTLKLPTSEFAFSLEGTRFTDFEGDGYSVSGKHTFFKPELAEDHQWLDIGFYGGLSYLSIRDKQAEGDKFFRQQEVVFGARSRIFDRSWIYMEEGVIEQDLSQNNGDSWKDSMQLVRLGMLTDFEQGFKLGFSLEHRHGDTSETGFNLLLTGLDDTLSIKYTKVGDYQNIGINFNLYSF